LIGFKLITVFGEKGQGDKKTRRQEDRETRRQEDREIKRCESLYLLVFLSPCLPLFVYSAARNKVVCNLYA
jgi:hypothetical protein